jgi:hypothetical protein
MNLKDDKQQNIQMQLDFSSALTGEAREAGREGTESSGAMNGTENPRVRRGGASRTLTEHPSAVLMARPWDTQPRRYRTHRTMISSAKRASSERAGRRFLISHPYQGSARVVSSRSG